MTDIDIEEMIYSPIKETKKDNNIFYSSWVINLDNYINFTPVVTPSYPTIHTTFFNNN